MINLTDIKVLVWDLDGTLYQSIPDLSSAMEHAFIKILKEHKNISDQEAINLLGETLRIHKSHTKSLQSLGCGTRIEIIGKIEEIVNKAAYLKVDPKLQKVFMELSNYQHALLSDTTHKTIVKELAALGLSHNLFYPIVGVDDTGTAKPDLSFFRAVLKQTGLKPENHLMIGDRIEVDLVPAKKLGMKTCLVWSFEQHPHIDYSFPTVYDIVNLFDNKE